MAAAPRTKLLRRLAAAALLIAALLAIWNVNNSYGTPCGMWISPETGNAAWADAENNEKMSQLDLQDALLASGGDWNKKTGWRSSRDSDSTAQVDSCASSRSARTPFIIASAVLGFALLGFAVTQTTTPAS